MLFDIGRATWTAFGLAAALLIAACGGAAQPSAADAPASTPHSNSPTATANYQIALASSDLAVGENRVAFGVVRRPGGPVTEASVRVSTFRLLNGNQEGPVETKSAVFRRWPAGSGVYTAELSFDRPGPWGLLVEFSDGGTPEAAGVSIQVKEASSTPSIGSPAPRSESKTLGDVPSLDQLTTDTSPDAELYRMSIAKALDEGKPLLVVFSTPLYCQTQTCGPQLDVVKELKAEYGDRASFIHVEVYDNPHEIEGDLRRARLSPAVQEWGLPSEPWTFIVGNDGMIKAKFEGFATREELEQALAEVVG